MTDPIFTAIASSDPEIEAAHARAADTMPEFLRHVLRDGDHVCAAKLAFKDPGASERLGQDVILYLWLTVEFFDDEEDRLVGSFFEVPESLRAWHSVGQELEFEPEDVFDWSVNEGGRMLGGFTLRLARNRRPEPERADFDRHIGVTEWLETPQ